MRRPATMPELTTQSSSGGATPRTPRSAPDGSAVVSGAPARDAARQADLLRLEGVGVRLGGRQVLSDVTFSLGKGDFAGIIGPNGAGKTTLLRVILGLLEPSGGQVLIDGEPVHR